MQRAGQDAPDLAGAVAAADDDLAAAVAGNRALAGMATTLTAAALTPEGRLVVAHVGDSRAYLLRRGGLARLTTDQTLVQVLVDAGTITPEEARAHPLRSLVLAALRGRLTEEAPPADTVQRLLEAALAGQHRQRHRVGRRRARGRGRAAGAGGPGRRLRITDRADRNLRRRAKFYRPAPFQDTQFMVDCGSSPMETTPDSGLRAEMSLEQELDDGHHAVGTPGSAAP